MYVVAPVGQASRIPVARKEAKPVDAVTAHRGMPQHAASRWQVLLGSRGEVPVRGKIEKLLGAKGLPASNDPARRKIGDRDGEPERVMWRSEPRQIPNQPMNDCGSLTRTRTSTRPKSRSRETRVPRAAGARRSSWTTRPRRGRGRVEANLANLGSSRIDVGP